MTIDYEATLEAINHRTNFANRRIIIACVVVFPTVLVSTVLSITVWFLTVSEFLTWAPFALGVTVTVFMLVWCYPPFSYRRWAHRFPEKANRLKELDEMVDRS